MPLVSGRRRCRDSADAGVDVVRSVARVQKRVTVKKAVGERGAGGHAEQIRDEPGPPNRTQSLTRGPGGVKPFTIFPRGAYHVDRLAAASASPRARPNLNHGYEY